MPEWTAEAACTELPPEQLDIFYSAGRESAAQAKAVCAACPVQQSVCASYGDRVSPGWGVFGGRTPAERRRQREARSEVAA